MKRPMRGPYKDMFSALEANPGTPYIPSDGKMMYVLGALNHVLFCHALADEDFNTMSDERIVTIAKVLMDRFAERN
jgi:hypothetical protein